MTQIHSLLFLMLCILGIAAIPKGCDGNVDLVFALDCSESVLDPIHTHTHPLQTWELYKGFVKAIIQRLPVGISTQVATIVFSSTAEVIFHFNEYRNSINIQDAVSGIQFMGGNTNTAHMLRQAQEEVFKPNSGDRPSARNVLVILSDGLFNMNIDSAFHRAVDLKASGTEIYTMASGMEIHANYLHNLASEPTDKYFIHSTNVSQLEDIADVLVHRICGLPDPDPVPTEPPKCEVEYCQLCQGELCESCIQGMYFNGSHCVACQVKADLTVLMDDSGSIRDKNPEDGSYDNYQLLKDFIKKLLQRLDIGPDGTRISIIRFSTTAVLEFRLDQYSSASEMSDVVDNFPYSRGHTNISGAIRTMREQVYLSGRGDRENILDVGLIITDGESTKDAHLTLTEAELAKNTGITLFVVGITDEVNEEELSGIASDPDNEHYFNSTEIIYLDQILTQVTKYVCAAQSDVATRTKRATASDDNGRAPYVDDYAKDHYVNVQDSIHEGSFVNSMGYERTLDHSDSIHGYK